ncbi:MAG TPA: VCBS repeat-containing protein [Planctomicrobium sp.]|nr:VCBS repeat-containing protein [Planctomicrobium sp.]
MAGRTCSCWGEFTSIPLTGYWYENPGDRDQPWKQHYAFERVRGESPDLIDIDGDGRPELLCHWEGKWGWISPDWKRPADPWTFHPVGETRDWDQYYHGEGWGDLNGDGRIDIILNDGWYEQPATLNPEVPWRFHAGVLSTDRGGAQILLDDVDQDGDQDIISSLDGHGWGLAWFEQLAEPGDGEGVLQIGERSFRRHRLMGNRSEEATFGVAFSQPHALALADLDGRKDILTGKRVWAHGPNKDEEPMGTPVLYWFQSVRNADGTVCFVPHLIDDHSGVGTQLTVADVNQDGRPDVLTVSKLGAFLFLNRGPSGAP